MPPKTTKARHRILAPKDWLERHLDGGWDEQRDGPIPTFGIDYPPARRAEAGHIVDDLPAESIPWLLADGHIELVEE